MSESAEGTTRFVARVSGTSGPLSLRQRRSASVIGAIALSLITVGVILAGIVAAEAVAFVAMAVTAFGDVSDSWTRIPAVANSEILNLPGWVIVSAGFALMIAGLVVSGGLLRQSGVIRPWAVTWASVGISVVPVTVVVIAAFVIAALVSGSFIGPNAKEAEIEFSVLLVMVPLSVFFTSVFGALVWRWMTHVFR